MVWYGLPVRHDQQRGRRMLLISEVTVKNAMLRIYAKLGLSDR